MVARRKERTRTTSHLPHGAAGGSPSGGRAGRRVPALRLRAGHRARAGGARDQHRGRCRRRGRGHASGGDAGSAPGSPPTRRPLARRWSPRPRVPPPAAQGFVIVPSRAGRRPHSGLTGRGDLRDVPGGTGGPGGPALPAPVHHLHPLRPAIHHRHRPALRPADDHDGGASPCAPTAPREYADPADRRFHAQPVACPRLRAAPRLLPPTRRAGRSPARPVAGARRLLARGASSRSRDWVATTWPAMPPTTRPSATLRKRKARGDKPFAVMAADLETAARSPTLAPAERELLTDPPAAGRAAAPQRADSGACGCAEAVAPGSPDLGVMLPYTPLHHLLLGLPGDPPGPRLLVMTSGNLAGEPIVTDDERGARAAGRARRRLADARPPDPRAVRRLGGAGRATARSCWSAALAATPRCPLRCR